LTNNSGTSSVVREDAVPGGGIGAERSIIADGVFGGGGVHFSLFRMEEKSFIILV
jgi:hypothetical protein